MYAGLDGASVIVDYGLDDEGAVRAWSVAEEVYACSEATAGILLPLGEATLVAGGSEYEGYAYLALAGSEEVYSDEEVPGLTLYVNPRFRLVIAFKASGDPGIPGAERCGDYYVIPQEAVGEVQYLHYHDCRRLAGNRGLAGKYCCYKQDCGPEALARYCREVGVRVGDPLCGGGEGSGPE